MITAPTEEWVITRLGRVADVANIAPVTEENDPNGNLNKPGGYTSTVYFGTALLGTQNLSGNPLIDEGTDNRIGSGDGYTRICSSCERF